MIGILKRVKLIPVVKYVLEVRSEKRRIKCFKEFYNCGRYSYALSPELIKPGTKIGSFCSIGRNVQIGPGKHPVSFLSTSPFSYYLRGHDKNIPVEEKTSRITNANVCVIEDDVWIGTNVIVMEGIHIGRGAVIGANAVVTRDVEPYTVVAGIPARLVKKRFDNDMIDSVEQSEWWKYPDELLLDLPLDDKKKSIDILHDRAQKIRRESKVCFIITSCIEPMNKPLTYSDVRSAYSVEERLQQTRETIESITKYCPGAYIVLVDNGINDWGNYIDGLDEYYYVGKKKCYNYFSKKDKSLGESIMLLYALKRCKKDSDIYFKISGRYHLNDKFDLAKYDLHRFNFLNYENGEIKTVGISSYKEGSYSTRLYSVPKRFMRKYRIGLLKSLLYMMIKNTSIEYELPKHLVCEFYYHDILGIQGNIGVDKNLIQE